MSRIDCVLAANKGEPVIHNIVLETKELLESFCRNLPYASFRSAKPAAEEDHLQRKITAEIERKRRETKIPPKARAVFVDDDSGGLFESRAESVDTEKNEFSEEYASDDSFNEAAEVKEERESGSRKNAVWSGNRQSRYESDFEEIAKIGKGAFGVVYKVRNRLDGLICFFWDYILPVFLVFQFSLFFSLF